jgi:hypothetical protein
MKVSKRNKIVAAMLAGFILLSIANFFLFSSDRAIPATSEPLASPLGVVTLHATPGNTVVQMFASIAPDPNLVVTEFRDGTQCDLLDGPIVYTPKDTRMTFYKLNCNGTIGYVNTEQVE